MSKGLGQFENTDWGTLSDSDFAAKKAQVMRIVEREAREKKLREDSAHLETEAGADDD